MTIGGDAGWDDEAVVRAEVHVALRLLVVRRDTMAHELVRARPRDTVDGEAEGRVLQGAVVPGPHEDAHELGDFFVGHLLLEGGRRRRRVAETPGDGHGAVGIGCVVEKRH